MAFSILATATASHIYKRKKITLEILTILPETEKLLQTSIKQKDCHWRSKYSGHLLPCTSSVSEIIQVHTPILCWFSPPSRNTWIYPWGFSGNTAFNEVSISKKKKNVRTSGLNIKTLGHTVSIFPGFQNVAHLRQSTTLYGISNFWSLTRAFCRSNTRSPSLVGQRNPEIWLMCIYLTKQEVHQEEGFNTPKIKKN